MEWRPRSDAYRAALEGTVAALQRRARLLRNQAITVVVVAFAAAFGALVSGSPRPLGIALALVPICGCFLLADARLVQHWLLELLERWVPGDLDLAGFREAVRAHPRLPRETLEGMLATLPLAGDLVAEQRIAIATRGAAAVVIRSVHQRRLDSILLNVFVAWLAVGAAWASLGLRRWTPLAALAAVAVRPVAAAWMQRRGARRARGELERCRRDASFSESDYSRLLDRLE